MPLLEYTCLDCETTYEVLSGVSEEGEALTCPACGSSRAEKALSTFSAKVAPSANGCPLPAAARSSCCGPNCGCHH